MEVLAIQRELNHSYSSITNKLQRYTVAFITTNALHISGCSSAHHQQIKTVYTASGICRAFSDSYRYRELLMMGGGTA
jgi:hypothetical protein